MSCGCKIELRFSGTGQPLDSILYCPLHGAAEALRDAAKPFSACAERLDTFDNYPDSQELSMISWRNFASSFEVVPTVGDLRRCREALRKAGQPVE